MILFTKIFKINNKINLNIFFKFKFPNLRSRNVRDRLHNKGGSLGAPGGRLPHDLLGTILAFRVRFNFNHNKI